jgi:hypothetical protein
MKTMTDDELIKHVTEDIRCHKENGVSLNPYSTVGIRLSWQNGYEGKPEHLLDYETAYRRGKMCRELIEKESG